MSVKITATGIALVEGKLKELKEELDAIREEKNVAYNVSGDTWHDNPGFKILEQAEAEKQNQIRETETVLAAAEIIEVEPRDMERVQIGSIGRYHCVYPRFVEDVVYEIVGYGETDFDKGRIQYDALVAQNLLGMSIGETKAFVTPAGEVTYHLLDLYSSWDKVPKEYMP